MANPLMDNLVSWWRFEEGTGTTTKDSFGSSNGTLNGPPTWTNPGKIGRYCLAFDGSDSQYVSTALTIPLGSDGTWCAWIKRATTLGDDVIFGTYGGGGNNSIWMGVSSGNWLQSWGTNGTLDNASANTQWTDTNWHLLTMVKSSGTCSLYFDNNSTAVASYSAGTGAATSTTIQINGVNGITGFGFQGSIDEVHYYNAAKSTSDIAAIYAFTGGSPPPFRKPLRFFRRSF